MIRQALRTLFFQKTLDHLLSIFLLFLLMGMASLCLAKARQIAEVCARVASQDSLRVGIHYTYALTGEWSGESSTLFCPGSIEESNNPFLGDEAKLDKGAIHMDFTTGRLAGETVSLRPAVPVDNVVGPISWVVGPGTAVAGRLILGEDTTTIASQWILFDMR